MSSNTEQENVVYITPLLKRLWPTTSESNVTAGEIANAISHIFTNSLTPVQTGALLSALNFTGLDTKAEVLSKCSQAMRNASAQIDKKAIRDIIKKRGRKEGSYRGGLVSHSNSRDVDSANWDLSAMLSAREVTHTTPSTLAQQPPS